MSGKKARLIFFLCLVFPVSIGYGQLAPVTLSKSGEFFYTPPFSVWHYSAYTPCFDRNNPRYLYAASAELGLVVFDVINPANPLPVDTFPTSQFHGLKVMHVTQQGNYLYLALGSYEGLIPQNSGIAIMDATTPGSLSITDVWDSVGVFNKGCTQVLPDGNYAYMGIMNQGILVMDVSNVYQIRFTSHFLPDLNWPVVPGPFTIPHSRGMAVDGNILYVAYDAGGLRAIDMTDKTSPVEIGKYRNLSLDAAAQPAYNGVVIVGNYAYRTVDYCGVDVVDISTPSAMTTHHWFNPWQCTNTNWSGRPGHTNQLVTLRNDSMLVVSGGDSEVLVFGIAPPGNLDSLGSYTLLQDSTVSWGIDAMGDLIATATIDFPDTVPYVAVHGGVQLYRWSFLTGVENPVPMKAAVYPNPGDDLIRLELPADFTVQKIICINLPGEQIFFPSPSGGTIPVSHLSPGIYILCLMDQEGHSLYLRWIKK